VKIAFVFNRKTSESIDQAEFDTTETIESIHKALASGGHDVIDVEMSLTNSLTEWMIRLKEEKPDLIFNTAEGYFGVGRESLGPTIFEQLQIPYVGSGPYGCFLTLDKFLTKQMVASRGVLVAEGYCINQIEELESVQDEISYPAFVKPNYEGSSKGITERSICRDAKSLREYTQELLRTFGSGVLIEKFIPGRDVTVPFIAGLGDGGVLEPLDYVFDNKPSSEMEIYDYDLKNFNDQKVAVRCPAPLEPHVKKQLQEMMKRIVPAVGITDFARADFRVTSEGEIFFLEVNALPSLQAGAGIFESAKTIGLDYNQTILKILEAAVTRLKLGVKATRAPKRIFTKKPRIGLVYNLKRKHLGEPGYEHEAEFDSEKTVGAISEAIKKQGFEVVGIEARRSLSEALKEHRIDIVFNIAEGSNKRAREAQVPAICDLLGIEHTGSDATCLAITLDKAITKRLLIHDGIYTPNFRLYQGGKLGEIPLKFPVICKPNHEGTSKGIGGASVVKSRDGLDAVVGEQYRMFGEPILIEEYVEGRELTIGVLGNHMLKILGPMEISFTKVAGQYPVYSFEAKHDNPQSNPVFSLVCPVSLGKEMDRKIINFAKRSFRSLGCRDVARIDFKLGLDQKLYFLEVNPLPGLAPGFSDLVVLAERSGVSYHSLIHRILNPAIQRWRLTGKTRW